MKRQAIFVSTILAVLVLYTLACASVSNHPTHSKAQEKDTDQAAVLSSTELLIQDLLEQYAGPIDFVPKGGFSRTSTNTCEFNCQYFYIDTPATPACKSCTFMVKYKLDPRLGRCYEHPKDFKAGLINSTGIASARKACSAACDNTCVKHVKIASLGLFKQVVNGIGEGVLSKPIRSMWNALGLK